MKIHIIGGPGSGKSTLAKCIASRLRIPHYDLDKVNWEKESAVAIAEQLEWITEGIYLIWTEPMLYHADYIVLLEVSWPVAAWRIVSRHIINSLRGTNAYPGLNGIKLLFKLLKDTRRYLLNQDNSAISALESLQTYLEQHSEIANPPTEEFVQMYFAQYKDLSIPSTKEFVRMYLERYKGKVTLVRNNTDRDRLLEILKKQF